MKNLVRGGQVSIHSIRMWMQLLLVIIKFFIFSTIFCLSFLVLKNYDFYDLKSLSIFLIAKIFYSFGLSDYHFNIVNRAQDLVEIRVSDLVRNPSLDYLQDQFFQTILSGLGLCLALSLIMSIVILAIFKIRGRVIGEVKFLRGAKIVPFYKLKIITFFHNFWHNISQGKFFVKKYNIAQINYPSDNEFLHTIVMGSTGTGKTTAILDLIDQIKKNGDRAIVYDKMGSYTSLYYDDTKDTIINPLDGRSKSWSLFNEVRKDSDFDYLSLALIQEKKASSDPFWNEAARKVLSVFAKEIYRENKNITNREFVDSLLKADYKKIAEMLEGTEGGSLINKDSEKTALSILAVLSTYISSMKYLHDDGEKFSIKDWVEQNHNDGFLFISSKGDQHDSLKPLISAWMDIAVKSLLSLNQKNDRKIWIILDEVASLHNLPSLLDGLSQSRQFGGAFVVAIHSISQLKTIYGRDATDTITSLCRNKLFFAVPDNEAAEFCSQNLGLQEIEEIKEGMSYGAHQMRDGVNLSTQKQMKKLVLPSEMMLMDKLAAYIKFGGSFPVAKVRFFVKDRLSKAPRFVEKVEEERVVDKKMREFNDESFLEKEVDYDCQVDNKGESRDAKRESYNILDD